MVGAAAVALRAPGGRGCGGALVQRARERRAGLRDRARRGRADCRSSTAPGRPSRRSVPTSWAACSSARSSRATATASVRGGGAKSEPLTVLLRRLGAAERGRLRAGDSRDAATSYLTTRDGTKLAIYVHPPEDVSNALPTGYVPHVPAGPDADADRVLGLRLRGPGRPAERHLDHREPDGLHRRRREHARHRLLGRRIRLLRAASEPRRLRHRSRRSRASRGSSTARSG